MTERARRGWKPTFWFGASLRIHGRPELHAEITERLGTPSECHKKGEIRSDPTGRTWPNDIWMIESPLDERCDISEHLAWIDTFARPHMTYLRRLIRRGARIDVYMSYRSTEDHCGFGLPPERLEFIARLGVPLEVSVLT